MKRYVLPLCSILVAGCLFSTQEPEDDGDNSFLNNITPPNNVAPNVINECGECAEAQPFCMGYNSIRRTLTG